MENLPGDARSEFRREFYDLNNLAVMIGCERHTVKVSSTHVTGFERNDGAAEAPFFFSWSQHSSFFPSLTLDIHTTLHQFITLVIYSFFSSIHLTKFLFHPHNGYRKGYVFLRRQRHSALFRSPRFWTLSTSLLF